MTKEQKSPDIYSMKLHDCVNVHDGSLFIQCLRVAGGWIYLSFDKGNKIMSSSFVPFDNSFQDNTITEF